MNTAPKILAGLMVTALLGAAIYIALTPGPADAGYGIGPAPQVESNRAAKADRAEPRREPLPNTLEVAEIRHEGDGFVLIDAKGREVYRSDPDTRTTTVERNVDVPLLTGYGVATSEAPRTPLID